MTAMKFQLVLCFLLGLYAFASANSEYDVNFVAESSGYPHAGRPEVWINGAWATICAGSGWDMNDAEVFCRDLGKGYPNTITVSGGVTQSGSATKCLSRVNCYGHENSLRDCDIQPSDVIDRSADQDVGIVCYPPPSDAGIKLTYGPDQYSGRVEVKLASGSWDELYGYDYGYEWSRSQYLPNICRQLGYGELNWWDAYEHSSAIGMTEVYDCAYGVAHHRGCSLGTVSSPYQAFVGCHQRGSIPCSAPYVPNHATIIGLHVNYNFGDRVTVVCDTNGARFTLQCHNKGLWSGPVVSCPVPGLSGPIQCSAPYVPHHATIDDFRVNYNFGDRVNVTCDTGNANFTLQCHDKGLWSGTVESCPEPDPSSHAYCSAPSVPPHSTIQNYRLTYKNGDPLNVTCDHGTSGDRHPWFILECDDGIWTGQNIVCSGPDIDCNQPIIPVASSIEKIKPRYKVWEDVNITCNDGSDWFVWECQTDGMWRGSLVQCHADHLKPPGEYRIVSPGRPALVTNKPGGTDIFVTGLLVTAVILFIMVLMCMSVFFIYVRSRSLDLTFSRSSKENLQEEKGNRGPLPDVPDGYANYIVGDQALYVEPYLKQGADDPQSYETFEKPI